MLMKSENFELKRPKKGAKGNHVVQAPRGPVLADMLADCTS